MTDSTRFHHVARSNAQKMTDSSPETLHSGASTTKECRFLVTGARLRGLNWQGHVAPRPRCPDSPVGNPALADFYVK